MATLGYTSTPPDSGGADVGRIIVGRVGPIPSTGTIDSISVYINAPNASYGEFIGILYSDNAGSPDSKVAQTAAYFGLPDSTPAWKTADTTTNPSLTSGNYYWVGCQVEHDSMVMYIDTGLAGDTYQIDSGTFGTIPNPFGTPSTIRTDYTFAAYFTYSAGDVTAPSLTVGPTVSSITSAGFAVSGTPDENGTAYLIVTAVGASQPSNGTFDASTETASMTASSNFNIVHTGQ